VTTSEEGLCFMEVDGYVEVNETPLKIIDMISVQWAPKYPPCFFCFPSAYSNETTH